MIIKTGAEKTADAAGRAIANIVRKISGNDQQSIK